MASVELSAGVRRTSIVVDSDEDALLIVETIGRAFAEAGGVWLPQEDRTASKGIVAWWPAAQTFVDAHLDGPLDSSALAGLPGWIGYSSED